MQQNSVSQVVTNGIEGGKESEETNESWLFLCHSHYANFCGFIFFGRSEKYAGKKLWNQ